MSKGRPQSRQLTQAVAGEEVRHRILVAEDDAPLRRLLELRLEVDGYDVRSVADGAQALATLAESASASPSRWEPEVFICDVMMPNMSGLSVCRELRAQPQFSRLPIILLTARVFDEDIDAVMQLGRISFVNKPFNAARLNQILCKLLDPELPESGNEDLLGWLIPPAPVQATVESPRRTFGQRRHA